MQTLRNELGLAVGALLLLDVHFQSRAVNEIEMFQVLFAFRMPALDDLRSGHCVRERMV